MFSTSITFYYLYRFVKLIFNFIFVMFKYFKRFIFVLKQINITILCTIMIKRKEKKDMSLTIWKERRQIIKKKKGLLYFPTYLYTHSLIQSKKKENIGLSLSLSLKKKIIPHLSIYPSHLLFLAFIVVAISITIKPTASQCL